MTPDHLNEWRVIPRLLIFMYAVFAVHVGMWFMDLGAPTTSQAAFVSTIWGAAAAWFGLYCNSGGKP